MSLGFTYSSNTLMMHLQDLVGADKMKSWYERFDLAKTGGMFDGEAAGNIGWANELQQKHQHLVNPQLLPCSNDSSTIGFL